MFRDAVGFKGYIGSRPFYGERTPQHIQNLVVRDYCQRNDFNFLLSATEYAMPDCFMILDQLIEEISSVDGIVAYSMFMLPNEPARRQLIYSRTLDADRSLHFAVEGLCVDNSAAIVRIENMWRVRRVLPDCPQTLT